MNYSAFLRATRKYVMNAHVEYVTQGRVTILRVEAPYGHHWATGEHELVDEVYTPAKPDFTDMLERMSCGIEICNAACEWWL